MSEEVRGMREKSRVGVLVAVALAATAVLGAETADVSSPDGRLMAKVSVGEQGLTWELFKGKAALVLPSRLGLEFVEWRKAGAMKIVARRPRSADETWTTGLSRRATVRDRYNELAVDLEEVAAPHRRLGLVLRAYDEGVAFRYVVPEQPDLPGFQLMHELTEWRFAGDPESVATVYPGHVTSQEGAFERTKLGSGRKGALMGMPLLVKTGGATLALTEACLVNWAGHFYRGKGLDGESSVVQAELSPLPPSGASTPGVAVIRTTPCASPWRVVIVGDGDVDLLKKNDIVANLNPPPEAGTDFSWVKPGASSWDWWVESNNSLSTELTLKLVDFAAEMGWPYHTIDGGWYGFARRPNHGPDVKIEVRKGFDLSKVVAHAAEKGVGIWVWLHWEALTDNGIDETFAKLEKWGVKGAKIDFIDRQDQKIVCWYEQVCRSAARHRIMVNFHGAHKPTGTERTWPNNLTREGIRGNEMCKFTAEITPEHCLTLPFTRFLIGPGDFTPGGFGNVLQKDFVPQTKRGHRYGDEKDRRPIWAEEIGTRAHAIARCIAFDSPLMTLCDWPERYRGAPGVEALRRLPTVWKSTTPICGECGSHYAVVREAFDGSFYFAALTVKKRSVDFKLDFLGEGEWEMQVFADDPELTPGDPKAIALASRKVRKGQPMGFDLLAEGGAVAIFRKR